MIFPFIKGVKPLFALAALAWLMFLVVLSAAKSAGHWREIWGSIELFVGGNRWMHFYCATILSVLCLLAIPGSWSKGVVLSVLIAGCAADETLQYFLPLRNFNPLDFAATLSGLIVGWLVVLIVDRVRAT